MRSFSGVGSTESPTDNDLRSAMESFHSYCGRYEVNTAEGTVVHHVEFDSIPNAVRLSRKRIFPFPQNQLHLSADLPPGKLTEYSLTWEWVEE